MKIRVRGSRQGEMVTLTIEATDPADARTQATEAGVIPISARITRQRFGSSQRASSGVDVLTFSSQMMAMLEAGLSVTQSLQALRDQEQGVGERQFYASLLQGLGRGLSFSQALDATGEFSDLYIGMMRAAEFSSGLPAALGRYISHHQQMSAIRQKLIGASIYPLILSCAGTLVILFLAGYVIPRFAAVYQASGRSIPVVSGWLLALHDSIVARPYMWLSGAFGVATALSLWVIQVKRRGGWSSVFAGWPLVGPRIRLFWLGHLYRTLGLLMQAGLPLYEALRLVHHAMPVSFRTPLARAMQRVKEGAALSQALELEALTLPICLRFLQAGERSSQLAHMLLHSARYCDEENNQWLERATRAFEPLMMTVIGVIVGALVLMLYMPIFELTGSLE